MSGLNADNLLAAAAVWVAIMLPSSAFGENPVQPGVEALRCQAQDVQAQPLNYTLHDGRIASDRAV